MLVWQCDDYGNRKEFPKELIRKKSQMTKGEFDLLFNGSVATLVWMDKRPIYFVISIYVSSLPVYVMRYNPGEHRRVAIPAPKAVKAYNDYMDRTDRND